MSEDGIEGVLLTKKCSTCGEVKSLSEFYKCRRTRDGFQYTCKVCNKSRLNDWYSINKDKRAQDSREFCANNPHRAWVNKTLTAHRCQGFTVNINSDELFELAKSTSVCPLCGREIIFEYGRGLNKRDGPSLDRKFNGNRLTLNNTWIICRKCNIMKQDLPFPEYVAYCKRIVDKFGGEYL